LPSFDDFGHLFNAFKDTRPWLENIRRVDLVNFAAPYRRDAVPSRSRRYLSQIYRLATPTGENDLRICIADSDAFNLPLPRSLCVGSKKYIVVAADKLYGFTHPADASDERFVPFFEVDARSRFLTTAQILKLTLKIGS
jgi:hypothetical protein